MKDNRKSKRITVIILILSILLIVSIAGLYHHGEKINLHMLSMLKNKNSDSETDTSQVNFRVLSNVGAGEYLNAEIVIPCENENQYQN